jgi:hypothetical protein
MQNVKRKSPILKTAQEVHTSFIWSSFSRIGLNYFST